MREPGLQMCCLGDLFNMFYLVSQAEPLRKGIDTETKNQLAFVKKFIVLHIVGVLAVDH